MATVSSTIERDFDVIMSRWADEAQRSASARGLDGPALLNIMPRYLESLAHLDGGASRSGRLMDRHLSARLREGYTEEEIVEELAILGRCIAAGWENDGDPPGAADVARLFHELNRAAVATATAFQQHLIEDAQSEKRYTRRLQAVASEAPRGERPAPLGTRLRDALEVICEAMSADTVALLLFDEEAKRLFTTASVGKAADALERHARELGSSSLAKVVAESRDEPVEVSDVTTTHLDVGAGLRDSGIRALLGLRLPSRDRLIGALYIGRGARGEFSARAVRRAEMLAEQLTLHLYNAALSAELRARIAELDTDRGLRERFVSVLAHDLRGPLSNARLHAERLTRDASLGEHRDELKRIVQSIDRADRMIRDLLDSLLIRAGRPLPLRIDACDLAAIARDVATELAEVHGERFEVRGDDAVLGWWSADDLRRAIWNLTVNAVKYGGRGAPIVLTVRRSGDAAELSVHNDGPPIPAEKRAQLFQPFGQLGTADSGRHGWGLGLTLVQGAVAAHGGTLTLVSEAGQGTTFTMHLPIDARGI